MATYRMESRTRAGAYLATLPFRNLSGEWSMNKAKTLKWDMPLSTAQITTTQFWPGLTEVWLYRNDVLIFAGPVWNATASSQSNTFACDAESIEGYFDCRVIKSDVSYSGVLGQIAWSIINTSQSLTDGSLYITQGTLVPNGGPSGTVTYAGKEHQKLTDAINDLSLGTQGFDYEITPQRVFNEYYPRVNSAARVRLEYGGNITSYSVQVMGKWEANWVQIKGTGSNISNPAIDTTLRAKYGLRDYVETNNDIRSMTELNDYATQALKLHGEAKLVPQISVHSVGVNPFDGDITIGQVVPLVIDNYWVQYNQSMRLSGFGVNVGKHGEETFTLHLNDLREIT